MRMEQVPMGFMRPANAPAARAEYGREEPVKKPPQEAGLHKKKWDTREGESRAILRRARELQEQIEREHGAMAAVDGAQDADETFGEDLRAVRALVADLASEPENKAFHAMLDELWERRMPLKRKSA